MIEQSISLERMEDTASLFGPFDENIRLIERELHVQIVIREEELRISGEAEQVMYAEKTIQSLLALGARGEAINEQNIRYVLQLVLQGQEEKVNDLARDVVCVTAAGKPIKAKTVGQTAYVRAIQNNVVTLGVGPAGTGKTYLAVAMAVAAFRARQVNRIILTRPAVEAGERLGFLPGDLQSKVDPYLRPLYDALFEMLGPETYNKYLERGNIEVAPLAYMRGRTLDDSFIILDEAQNTSREQMKMFLTRLGFGSKVVITGDITQIDLPRDKVSGLKEAMRVLKGVEDIAICRLTGSRRGAACAGAAHHPSLRRRRAAAEYAAQKTSQRKGEWVMIEHDIWLESELDAPFPYEAFLRQCITKALELEQVTLPCEINVLITDNEGIHRINLEQRQVDAPTDVLSFPMFDLTAGQPPVDERLLDPATHRLPLGDMVISLERATAQAEEYGHSIQRELGYLAVHSVLHLLGYDHMDEGQQKRQMRAREEAIMNEMGVPRG